MRPTSIVNVMGLSPKQIEKAEQVRQDILHAAAEIVIERGVQSLTLAAVASRARVSKGGLLHHFACKADLIRILVETLIADFETALDACAKGDPEPYGRRIRAYVRANLAYSVNNRKIAIALFPLSFSEPELVTLLRTSCDRWLNSPDEIDSVQSYVIRLATDGFWMADTMNIHSENSNLREKALEHLVKMTYPA
ncbi:TetR/AcrR family transcriptional regulator [Gluconobacter sp. OJA]|uniref:TetR/AcrR family transcriptional regulator n=1 Tax=Gluconobacter sp. OJA TaxID=3145197 RepID=UPI0031F92DF6